MEETVKIQPTCVDCGTQNCKFKVRTYPEFCPTTSLKEEDLQFLAESAYADACAPGNPREASVEDMKALIRQLM